MNRFVGDDYKFRTPEGTLLSAKSPGCRKSVGAFLNAAKNAVSSLDCIVETGGEREVCEMTIVHPDNNALPKLTVNYGGGDARYHAKVVLPTGNGNVQVATDTVDSAERRITKFLINPDSVSKRKSSTHTISRRVSGKGT